MLHSAGGALGPASVRNPGVMTRGIEKRVEVRDTDPVRRRVLYI